MITPVKRLELAFWSSCPGMIAVGLLLFCLTPKHIGGFEHFMPVLPLMPIFYWGLMHAREMPYWLVFLIGLVMDAATGLPLGLSSLSYIAFLALLHAQRKYIYKEGFLIKWGYFALLLLVISCIDWLLLSLMNSRAEDMFTAFLQWLFTIACYPAFHKGFDNIYRHINERRWQILHGH